MFIKTQNGDAYNTEYIRRIWIYHNTETGKYEIVAITNGCSDTITIASYNKESLAIDQFNELINKINR